MELGSGGGDSCNLLCIGVKLLNFCCVGRVAVFMQAGDEWQCNGSVGR
jgi:hypothetical protein